MCKTSSVYLLIKYFIYQFIIVRGVEYPNKRTFIGSQIDSSPRRYNIPQHTFRRTYSLRLKRNHHPLPSRKLQFRAKPMPSEDRNCFLQNTCIPFFFSRVFLFSLVSLIKFYVCLWNKIFIHLSFLSNKFIRKQYSGKTLMHT